LYLACQSDASAFRGIELTLSGDSGPGPLAMIVESASNIVGACQGGT
jgi:hypothetical protein